MNPRNFVLSASNRELLQRLEDVVSVWTNQIRMVLVECNQFRRDAYDVRPSAELEHWKRRMVIFSR